MEAKDGYEDKTGPCGGRLLPNIYYDPPFSYLAVTNCMWSNTLVRIVNTSECDDMHLDQCYQHLIPAYKDDLNRSLCYTTTDTQNAPTFSGVVGFNVDNFCKASATMDGLTAGKGSTVSKSCTTSCGVSGHSYGTNFLGPCKAPQTTICSIHCTKDPIVYRARNLASTQFIGYFSAGYPAMLGYQKMKRPIEQLLLP
ncbi:uncharacterized protein LOC135373654 [Ornithodoros turicata]|uniref:uncharacterized protein LOC135373654 n=1 Tax=Ornithodoros turicata TaxID=34597 RepID=UPI003139FD68